MTHKLSEYEGVLRSVTDVRRTCTSAGCNDIVELLDMLVHMLPLAHPGFLPGVHVLCREAVAAEVSEETCPSPLRTGMLYAGVWTLR